MNFQKISLLTKDAVAFWRSLKPITKILAGSLALLLPISFALFTSTSSTHLVPLYTAEQLKNSDLVKIKEVLDAKQIPYQINDSNLILVPKEAQQQLRMDLSQYGLLKSAQSKGYELFDSTTWIKGEKELQMLELRALKGQIEKDLTQFENVRNANVILDIPQNKSFSAKPEPAKASVILDLVPGTRLSANEIRAITFHLTSAVRGLTPGKVAISDTTGRMYQGLDYEGAHDTLRNAEMAMEEYVKSKIEGMLASVVGLNNFYTTVQVSLTRNHITEERTTYSGSVNGIPLGSPVISSIKQNQEGQTKTVSDLLNAKLAPKSPLLEKSEKSATEEYEVPVDHVKITTEPGKVESLSIGVVINQNLFSAQNEASGATSADAHLPLRDQNELKREIENQLDVILKGYNVPIHRSVDFVPFVKNQLPEFTLTPETTPSLNLLPYLALVVAIFGVIITALVWKLRSQASQLLTARAPPSPPPQKNLEELLDNLRNRASKQDTQANSTDEGSAYFSELLSNKQQEQASPSLPSQKSPEDERQRNLKSRLSSLPAQELAALLAKETAETLALLFCHQDLVQSSAIFPYLPSKKQVATLLALADFDQMDGESLQYLLQKSSRLFHLGADDKQPAPSIIAIAASTLQSLDNQQRSQLLSELEHIKPAFAIKILNLLFVAEELKPLSDKEIKEIIENISPIDVALALYDTDVQLQAKWMQYFSKDLLDRIHHQIELQQPITPYIIRAAQKDVYYYLHPHKGISV